MKKLLMIAAVVAATLVSCSKDQVVEIQQEGIKFSVATENATKAAEIYCSNYPLEDFLVYASYENQDDQSDKFRPYISGKEVSFNDTDDTYNFTNGAYYWPETGNNETLDFFAVKNGALSGLDDYNGGATMQCTFEVDDNVTNQKDLMYAVKMDAKKSDGNVALNFRHALSLIDFRARCSNTNMYVEISEVQICNIYGKGIYTLPIASTTTQVLDTDHDRVIDGGSKPNYVTDPISSRGNWSFDGQVRKNFSVFFATAVPVTEQYVSLTSNINSHTLKAQNQNSMLLIAQNNDAWQTKEGEANYYKNYDDVNNTGSYLLVKCKIYNVAGETVAKNDDGTINEIMHYDGYAAVPLKINWAEGHQYMYSLIFDKETDAGFDEGGDPILTSIKLTVTVDDFIGYGEDNDEHVGIETPVSSTSTANKN